MKEAEFNFIDRFLYKFLIVSFLLFSVVLLDKIKVVNMDNMQTAMSQHFNFLTVIKAINGEKGVLLPIDITEQVSLTNSKAYLDSKVIKNGRRVELDAMCGVENYKAGVIVKIYQNPDKTYQITVKGIDDYDYVYDKLESVNCNIYKVVSSGEIIGSPILKNEDYYFDFYVYHKGQVVNVIP